MKILDTDVEFDFLDADQVAKFEEEARKVIDKCKNNKILNLTLSETLRKECEIIDVFFDNLFGEGMAQEIFKGKMNLQEHIEAFECIVNEKIKRQNDLQNMYNKYLPNREQRRKNQYHKRNK